MKSNIPFVREFAVIVLICGLFSSAYAQLGSGWTPIQESYVIVKSPGSTVVPNFGGATFTIPAGFGYAYFKYSYLPTSVTSQFQGDVAFNSMTGNRIAILKLIGQDSVTPWIVIEAVRTSAGYEYIDAETGAVLALFVNGMTNQINVVVDPSTENLDIYINGALVEQRTGHPGPYRYEIGAITGAGGTGPAEDSWTRVEFWMGGVRPTAAP
jgi:hypothetical protein